MAGNVKAIMNEIRFFTGFQKAGRRFIGQQSASWPAVQGRGVQKWGVQCSFVDERPCAPAVEVIRIEWDCAATNYAIIISFVKIGGG